MVILERHIFYLKRLKMIYYLKFTHIFTWWYVCFNHIWIYMWFLIKGHYKNKDFFLKNIFINDIDLHTLFGQLNRQLAWFLLKLGFFFGFETESSPLRNMDVVIFRLCDWKLCNQMNNSVCAFRILSYFVANALWQKRMNFVQKLGWFFFFSSNRLS